MRSDRLGLVGSIGYLALVGCSHTPQLKPAPDAQRVSGQSDAAMQEVSGVRVVVDGTAWKGEPYNLSDVVAPVFVSIENHAGRPLRIRYQEFVLAGVSGARYGAIPPYLIRGSVRRETGFQIVPAAFYPDTRPLLGAVEGEVRVGVRPRYPHYRFYVVPHVGFYYPGFEPWPHPWAWDPLWYDRYYAYWPRPLPSQDMLDQALPEGVIDDGGRIAGFVYFQKVNRDTQVTFEMMLVDAQSGETFGVVKIPLVVSR